MAVASLSGKSGAVDDNANAGQVDDGDEDLALINDPANLLTPVERSTTKGRWLKRAVPFDE